jgi:Flp pilus assembly protein CpaB
LSIENEAYPGFEFPSEEKQRPRRVAQLTVQKGRIIKVGPWIEQPEDTTPTEEGAPTPTPVLPDIVSLAVTPQDALVLLWARQTGAYMELAMRAAGDEEADHTTEAVTLQYMLTRFNIAVPPKLEFGIDRSDVGAEQATPTPQAAPPPS